MDTIIITDRSGNQVNVTQPLVNEVNVTQPLVSVIEATALGPQGPKGNQGDQGPSGSLQPSNSGSFEITGSLLISGSGTLTNVGPAVFSGSLDVSGSAIISGSLSISGSVDNGVLYSSGSTVETDSGLFYDQSAATLSVGRNLKGGKIIINRPSGGSPRGYLGAENNGFFIGIAYDFSQSNMWFEASTKSITIGNGATSLGASLGVVNTIDLIAHRIDLSNGQTEDAFQINSFGNTGGDLLYITSTGKFVNADIIRTSYDGTTTTPAIQIGDSEVGLNGLGYDSANGIRIITGGIQSQILNKSQIRFKYWAGGASPAVSIYATDAVGTTNGRGSSLVLSGGRSSGNANGGDIIFKSSLSGVSGTSLNSLVEVARITNSGNVGIGTTSPDTTLHAVGGVTDGIGGARVLELEASLPSLWFKDTNGGGSGLSLNKYGNSFYFSNTNSSGAHLNYAGMFQLSSGKWTIGAGNNPLGQLDVKVQAAASIGQLINLANGQTADAFQINSFGNTGGDLFGIESDGLIRSQISTSNTLGQVHYNFPNAYSITNLSTLTSNKYSSFFGYYTGVKHQGLYIGTNSTGAGFIQNVDGTSAYRFAIQPYGAGLTIGSTTGMPNNKTFEVNGDSYFKDTVGIGTTSPDASAILEMDSTTKGFLPPRMTGAQVEAIASPAEGLLVYATSAGAGDVTGKGWWGYNGTNWVSIG